MGVYVDVIAEQGLGTGTAKTQLSGNPTGNNASSYTVPANCKGILYVQPSLLGPVTPTVSQNVIATMKIESDDLGLRDYEVFAVPMGGMIATTDVQVADLQRTAIYPLMLPTLGGELIQFYGIPQVANTVQPFMGASLWWTDNPGQITDLPFRAKVGGAAGGAASLTATGSTANGLVTGTTLTISGQATRTIRTITGVLVTTIPATGKAVSGYGVISSGEMAYVQRFTMEPNQGILGTTFAVGGHLTRADNLACIVQPPTTINLNLWLSNPPNATGTFGFGILYN